MTRCARRTAARRHGHATSRSVALLLLGLLLLGPCVSHAAPANRPRPRVAILSLTKCCAPMAWRGVEQRLAAELATLGVNVVWVIASRDMLGPASETLPPLALRMRAFAVVRITRPNLRSNAVQADAHSVVIAWHERLTGKTSIRRTTIGGIDRQTEALVALRAVELLRASLLELRSGARARTRSEARLPRKLRPRMPVPPKQEGPPRWSLRAAGALLYLLGGLAVRGGIGLALRWWAIRWLSLELQTDITPFGADLVELEWRTSVRMYGVSMAALWEIQGYQTWSRRRGWRLQPALGLLVGLRLAHIRGRDTADLQGTSRLQVQADLAAAAQVALRISGPARLRASIQVGAVLPPIGVRYLTGRVATLGAAYVSAQLGVELSW